MYASIAIPSPQAAVIVLQNAAATAQDNKDANGEWHPADILKKDYKLQEDIPVKMRGSGRSMRALVFVLN